MTRGDAVKRLQEVKVWAKDDDLTVIDMAIEALQQPERKKGKEWIPLKTRPMDEDERKELADKLGYKPEDYEAVVYTSPFPDDGQEVLICFRDGDIKIDTFEEDDYGCYFDVYGGIDGVVAWMPLPEPWEGEE